MTCWRRCTSICPKPHIDLAFARPVLLQGIKLTPSRHYAYLRIAEGRNHRCTFCIISSMRGNLVSRPIGDVIAAKRRTW